MKSGVKAVIASLHVHRLFLVLASSSVVTLIKAEAANEGCLKKDRNTCIETSHRHNWQNAAHACQKLGRDWSLLSKTLLQDHAHLSEVMQRYGIVTSWLPVHRQQFDSFRAVDGSNHTFIKPDTDKTRGDVKANHSSKMCASIPPTGGNPKPESCVVETRKNVGYICFIKDCRECPAGTWPNRCIFREKQCWTFHCQIGNWFAARASCIDMGGDLVVPDKTSITLIDKQLRSETGCSVNSWWVGYRKTDWNIISSKGEKTPLLKAYWDVGEPHYPGDCVVTERTGDERFGFDYSWRTEECNRRHAYICVRDTRTYSTSSATTYSAALPTDGGYLVRDVAPPRGDYVALVVMVVLLSVAVLVLGIMVAILKQRKYAAAANGEEMHVLQKNPAPTNV